MLNIDVGIGTTCMADSSELTSPFVANCIDGLNEEFTSTFQVRTFSSFWLYATLLLFCDLKLLSQDIFFLKLLT